MDVLIDSNVFIDYAQGKGRTVRFFSQIKRSGYEVYILPDVYAEIRAITNKKEFNKINSLINELKYQHQIYHQVEITIEEKELAENWKHSKDKFGDPIDCTDRHIIAVAKNRGYYIYSEDVALKELAKQLRCKII